MTTMSDPGTGYAGGTPNTSRTLRRSPTDRVISGVSGGLGQYFGVDPVIFRVLFAVLSFFGGVGLLAYGVAWLLIPEPEAGTSLLDRALHELRVRRVPPWLVVIGGAVVVWVAWFSWWAPGTLPALLLLAVVALVLMHRMTARQTAKDAAVPPSGPQPFGVPAAESQRTETTRPSADEAPLLWAPPGQPVDVAEPAVAEPAVAEPAVGETTPVTKTAEIPVSLSKETDTATLPPVPAGPAPADEGRDGRTIRLIPPLNDTRRAMQAWLAEAGEAHRERVRRRRPVKIAVLVALLLGWGFVALIDAASRVPFPAYLWVGLFITTAGLLISIVTRRAVLSLLVPILFLVIVTIGLGGTKASLSDGSGRIGWRPASQTELAGTYRQFAGQSTLDLTGLGRVSSSATVKITQAAGEVIVRIPAGLNVTVISDVHFGDIQNGTSSETGERQSGMNIHLQSNPPTSASGPALTVHVWLTNGHVQIDRV